MTTNARYTKIGADSLARMELTFENTREGDRSRALLEALIALRTKKGAVYTTVCIDVQGNEYVFTTTHREIQLALSSMAHRDRIEFAKMLEEELNDLGRTGLIFLMPMTGEKTTERAVHVTLSKVNGDARVFLNLAPAA